MALGPRTSAESRLKRLQSDVKRLADFDARHRPVLPADPVPHLDLAYHHQSWQGIPGGDVIHLRHLQTIPLGRGGRRVSYYWGHHMDWVAKGATAHVLSHIFSAGVSNLLSKVRFIPGLESKVLKQVASGAYHFMHDAGYGFEQWHIFAQGLMELVAVEHGGFKPSHVEVHFLNFAQLPMFVYRGSDPSGARLDWVAPGQGVPSNVPNLGLFLKDHPRTYAPRVLELGHLDALVSFSDGVDEARDLRRRYFGPHLLDQASRWKIRTAADFISRFKSSFRYFMRRSPHPVEDASLFVVRHTP